jgi:hypothetical protein
MIKNLIRVVAEDREEVRVHNIEHKPKFAFGLEVKGL